MKWKYTLLGIGFDVLDFILTFTVYGVPVVSVFTTLFWVWKLGYEGAVNGVQAVPGISALPINTAMGYLADRRGRK
jgi:hypothetical protein